MGKYFGTDGIRGIANVSLSLKSAFKVGAFLAAYFAQKGPVKIVIAKDTRLSSSMYENMISAAAAAYGAQVYQMGYATTPSLAYTVSADNFTAGVMISASHNPYYDNGIKVFLADGLKLNGDFAAKIEDYIDDKYSLEIKSYDQIGHIYDYSKAKANYLAWLNDTFPTPLNGLKIVLDLANGAACYTAKELMRAKEANVTLLNDQPDGVNINTACGSTHLEGLCAYMRNGDYDVGFAFDGDADRVLAVDNEGREVDGDKLMYLLAKDLKAQGRLNHNCLVTTVMSNIGLYKALNKSGIDHVVTSVGDRNVMEMMLAHGYSIGGEQSGHIINAHSGLFGDGLKTALQILEVMVRKKASIAELVKDVEIYPQLLINQKVKDKNVVLNDPQIKKAIAAISEKLADNGRILVRPSGTEPLIRVMAEAQSPELCRKYVEEIITLIKEGGYVA